MNHPKPSRSASDAWDNSDAYEYYVGRWSHLVGIEFLRWLAIPAGKRWLDAGCGTGMLSRTILEGAAPDSVLGVDFSEQYIRAAKRWTPFTNAKFKIGDARSLPVADQSVDVVVSGLMLNFVPETEQETAVRDMARATVTGGTVAAYVWDYAGGMEFMRAFWDAADVLDPAAQDLDEGRRFPICHPENLAALFQQAGLVDVETRAIDIPTIFEDFDDFWLPFLGGQGSAPGYLMSLDAGQQIALRESLRETLPVASDGTIRMMARAWAVRGRTL